jgi:hypothetical protein
VREFHPLTTDEIVHKVATRLADGFRDPKWYKKYVGVLRLVREGDLGVQWFIDVYQECLEKRAKGNKKPGAIMNKEVRERIKENARLNKQTRKEKRRQRGRRPAANPMAPAAMAS